MTFVGRFTHCIRRGGTYMGELGCRMNALLEVRNLVTHLNTEDGLITPVDDVSFTIHQSETLQSSGKADAQKYDRTIDNETSSRLQEDARVKCCPGEDLLCENRYGNG